jgi:hypothetical protein
MEGSDGTLLFSFDKTKYIFEHIEICSFGKETLWPLKILGSIPTPGGTFCKGDFTTFHV